MQVALRWFCSRSLLRHDGLTKDLIDRIPGKQVGRKGVLGAAPWWGKRPPHRPALLGTPLVSHPLPSDVIALSSPFVRKLLPYLPQSDRKTPLGELNWIFTAITDTIAWNVLPRPMFQKLFRSVRGEGFKDT